MALDQDRRIADKQSTTSMSTSQEPSETNRNPLPAIALPKGGGAIRGVGEKFAANPVTGTGSITVPLAVSPGRSGFGPQLSLSYDSGAGNGPFGFGWTLSLPAISRKTDKGLPQYLDAEESDVYILSGAEDLVPVLSPAGGRSEAGPSEVVREYAEAHYEERDRDPAKPEAEHHRFVRAPSSPPSSWAVRPDPSSSPRAGFEVRTCRRCRSVLMFHRFAELGSEPCLV